MINKMNIEYEATFTNIQKDEMRKKLKDLGAVLVRPEFLQKRTVFFPPKGGHDMKAWIRVRDEGDKITMSLKVVAGDKIEDQKEICITVDNFDNAAKILALIGCIKKVYQETKRELWKFNDAEITIDEWPFLEPFVEVEGNSEEIVKSVSEKLGFDWQLAKFCAIGTLYSEKYGLGIDEINNNTPRIIFGEKNPFIDRQI